MIRFNVFCGKRNFGKGWFHVDGNTSFLHTNHSDVTLKYEPNNYIDLLYCSHGIGYLTKQEFSDLLEVWYSKIKPGGILRIATPDFSILSKFYHIGLPLEKIDGPLMGNMIMNGDIIAHKTVYDEQKLTNVLAEAGFINIGRYDHTKTAEHPNTGNREDFFDDHSGAYINGTLISLNVQCQKPL